MDHYIFAVQSHAVIYMYWYAQAPVNVPGLSKRTLCRSICASGVTLTPEIQVSDKVYVV